MTDVVLGIDIGGTNTKFGFVDKEGKIFHQESINTRSFPKFQDLAMALHVHCSPNMKACCVW
jgi:glucokinase